jgi:hypothetical protein
VFSSLLSLWERTGEGFKKGFVYLYKFRDFSPVIGIVPIPFEPP